MLHVRVCLHGTHEQRANGEANFQMFAFVNYSVVFCPYQMFAFGYVHCKLCVRDAKIEVNITDNAVIIASASFIALGYTGLKKKKRESRC